MKETKDINKWKDIQCSWIETILLKCPHYPKQPTDSMQSPSKIPMGFFHRSRKNNPTFL